MYNDIRKALEAFKNGDGYAGNTIDYSNPAGWLIAQTDGVCRVDTVWICPTLVEKGGYKGIYAVPDDDFKSSLKFTFRTSVSALDEDTNIYAPFYHQIVQEHLLEQGAHDELICAEIRGPGYAEVCGALRYYFEHYNNGRPFILAGHSQGSAILQAVLAGYMSEHPEYLERMVAAYALGYAFSREYFEQNKHLKFAAGEDDTGCVVSWNTEGPGGTMHSNVLTEGALCINPLNWKLDSTPAPASENLGGYIFGAPDTFIPRIADAAVNPKRGVVECTTVRDYIPNCEEAFGDRSLHMYDWSAYYMNIKENARKRIAAYFKTHK